METCEIQARPRHQGSQTGDEVQRLQHHVGRAVSERLFVLVHDPAPAIDGQPLGGNGRAGDVSAQAFQAPGVIMYSLRGCGARSNTKKFIFTRMTRSLTHEMELVDTSIFTIKDGHTPLWDERRQIVYIFLSNH